MSKLSKWLPFKFNRKKREEQDDDASTSLPVRTPSQPMPARPSMDQMFDLMLSDRFWRSPLTMFDEMERFFGDFAPRAFQPSVDIIDEGKHIRVSAELPGLDRDDVELTVQEGLLIIHGQKRREDEHEEDGCYRVERYFGRFQRVIPLPSDVDAEGAEAKFDKGLLTIRFPKVHDVGSGKRIPIS